MKNNVKKPKARQANQQKFPPGWNEKRVRKVLAHYENQSEDEAAAEDEAAYDAKGQTVLIVPTELVPATRELLCRQPGASLHHRAKERLMHESDKQQPIGPHDLRPEERVYEIGWILWLIAVVISSTVGSQKGGHFSSFAAQLLCCLAPSRMP